jgi:hypothetical protein
MISPRDAGLLRELARRVDEIARLPVMQQRRLDWTLHNELKLKRPLTVVFPEGSWRELLPEAELKCEGMRARKIERELRMRIIAHALIDDDSVVERSFKVHKIIDGLPSGTIDLDVDWGLPLNRRPSDDGEEGAFAFSAVLNNPEDIKKLRVPRLKYRETETMRELDAVRSVLGDILDVKLVGVDYISFHIMYFYTGFRGLETMFYDLYDEPELAHRIVKFFADGYRSIVDQCLEQNLFSLNNDGTYQGTGGFGYTRELPADGFDGALVRTQDLWASAEAQEMAPVSPAQTEEFAISYERELLSRFGLNAYGCCEGLHDKLTYVKQIPNIRRISISPFADIERCAEQLKGDYIYSWKPNPVFVSGPHFDEDGIRSYLDGAMRAFREHGCVPEMILADTHTIQHEPERFTRWVQLCREATHKWYD